MIKKITLLLLLVLIFPALAEANPRIPIIPMSIMRVDGSIPSDIINVDNLRLDGNTLSSTSGTLNLTPVAGSAVVIDSHFSFDGTVMTAITDNNTTFTSYAGKNITIEGVTFDGGVVAGISDLTVQALTGAAVCTYWSADAAEDNSDKWRTCYADGGDMTIESFTSGSWVVKMTVSNAGLLTISDIATAVTIGTAYIYRAGGTDVPDADVADNITITNISQVADIDVTAAEINGIDDCGTDEIMVGGGAGIASVCTTASGTGAPARVGSPTFTGTVGGDVAAFTGDLSGLIPIASYGTEAVGTSAATMYGGIGLVTGANTVTLPAVVVGQSICFRSTTAATYSIDPNASDRIILDDTALDDGDKITSGSAAIGQEVCVFGDSAAGWTTMGNPDSFTDGG